jgi:hypothetical protein
MSRNGRPFANERHLALKLGMSALAVAGFAIGWMGFWSSHGSPAQGPETATPEATATPTSRLPGGSQVARTATSGPAQQAPTPRARTSRGS